MHKNMCRSGGFTLIELMVVVVVIGVLAAVGYPSYTEYVQRSRIAEATASLSDWRIRMERYFQDNRRYTKVLNDDGAGKCGIDPPPSDSFTYICENATTDEFEIRAEGGTAMAAFEFGLNQDNLRQTIEFPGVSGTQDCWMTRRGDTC